MHCIASAEANLIKLQYVLYTKSPPLTSNLCWHFHISLILIFNAALPRAIPPTAADHSKAESLSPASQLRAIHTHLFVHRQKTNSKIQFIGKTNK